MTVAEMLNQIIENGALPVLSAMFLCGIVLYVVKIIPQLQQISDQLKNIMVFIETNRDIINNNSMAMNKVAESLNILGEQVKNSNEINKLMLEKVLANDN